MTQILPSSLLAAMDALPRYAADVLSISRLNTRLPGSQVSQALFPASQAGPCLSSPCLTALAVGTPPGSSEHPFVGLLPFREWVNAPLVKGAAPRPSISRHRQIEPAVSRPRMTTELPQICTRLTQLSLKRAQGIESELKQGDMVQRCAVEIANDVGGGTRQTPAEPTPQ